MFLLGIPCCKKAFGRVPLCEHLHNRHLCLLCNANLNFFDVNYALKEIQLIGLLDTFVKLKNENNIILEQHNNSWSCKIYPLIMSESLNIAKFELVLNQSNFKIKPNLFILVVDRSGSMGGSPWRQVEIALKHIIILGKSNPYIKIAVITYHSNAEIIAMPDNENEMMQIIKHMYTGGGINFNAAFRKIGEVLRQQNSKSETISDVNIIFLTVGESGDDVQKLILNFREILRNDWKSNVCSVGFGENCNKVLLEAIRVCGTVERIFRYTDTNSNQTDALCNKLTLLFDTLSNSSTVDINLDLVNNTKNCLKQYYFNILMRSLKKF